MHKMHNKIRKLGEEHSRYFLAFVVMLIALSLFILFTSFFVGVAESAIAPTAPLMGV